MGYGKSRLNFSFSIGCTLAAYIWHRNAKNHPIQGILMISPPESVLRVAFNVQCCFPLLMPLDVLPLYHYLENFDDYLYVVYTEDDGLISSKHAKRLVSRYSADHCLHTGSHSEWSVPRTEILRGYFEKYEEWLKKDKSIIVELQDVKSESSTTPLLMENIIGE